MSFHGVWNCPPRTNATRFRVGSARRSRNRTSQILIPAGPVTWDHNCQCSSSLRIMRSRCSGGFLLPCHRVVVVNAGRSPSASPDAERSVQRMPAWLPSVGGWVLRRAVSSAPYNPAVAGARRRTRRVAGPVLRFTISRSSATDCSRHKLALRRLTENSVVGQFGFWRAANLGRSRLLGGQTHPLPKTHKAVPTMSAKGHAGEAVGIAFKAHIDAFANMG